MVGRNVNFPISPPSETFQTLHEDEDAPESAQMIETTEDVAEGRDKTPTSEPPVSPDIFGDVPEYTQANTIMSDDAVLPESPAEPGDSQKLKSEKSHPSTQNSTQEISRTEQLNLGLQMQCPKTPPLDLESEEESDTDEELRELVVLDPDHPLMKRFQEALNNHLSKQLDKLVLEVRELTWRMKTQTTERENTGVLLYGTQQSLAQIQMELEKLHDRCSSASEKRRKAEEDLANDMFVNRLVSQMDTLREQIAMYEAQYIAQVEETKAARRTVAEATMEIEAIGYEKKQLIEQWTSSLIGMQRRDEAYAAMQEAVRQSRHQLDTLKTEMYAYNTLIMKQEEKNEFLTVNLNRLTNDVNMTQKMIAQNLAKQEALKHEYSTYTRTLHETERLLNKASLDKNIRQSEIKVLQLQIEKEYAMKVKLEDEIMAKLESELTMNQATNYLKRLGDKLRIRKRQLEIDYAKTENEYAQINLEMNDRKAELTTLQKILQEQYNELTEKNNVISLSEKEIAKRLLAIQNKQSVLNMHNKRIAQLIAEMGGREMSPLELKIKTLTKSIEEHNKEISTQQQYWLKQQHELVRLTQEREKQTADVELQKKQVTILQQKKIRTENMIQQGLNAKKDIERHMRALSNDMVKLNGLLTKNASMKDSLEHSNILMENEFVTALKDAEREAIEKQQKLDQLKEEKERLVNSLVEAERQIMLWEKKIQLAKEARSAVDSDVGQNEIRAMKAEIHRMQIRHNQLMRQQEQMIREMEAVVLRRDTIVTRAEAQVKLGKKQITKQDCHKTIEDLCKKIADVQKNIEESDRTIEELRESQRSLCQQLEEKQSQIHNQQSMVDQLNATIESQQERKQANLTKIVTLQTRLKHLEAAKEGKYILQCKSEQLLRNEIQKQENRIHTINTIVARIQEEWPQYQGILRKVTLALAARGTASVELP
ncbi:hypothetical protein chiPu_0003641 [Chiloscyllium punctatum]|uniref:Coiled-coil domain-containing protein 40 n=1 Tax=Chiloscyllium punctatum TaxID=137246 RepID=A0A401S493_CHIPU|nr:hypothetical protein [Chiloscyllium punctatum]